MELNWWICIGIILTVYCEEEVPLNMKISYNPNGLKAIRKASTQEEYFSFFTIALETHWKIIAMGICRHPRPYRRSRAATKLFHKITSIISWHRDETTESLSNSVNNSALIRCVGMFNTADQPYTVKCGLVNCWLVVNKTQLIQTEVSVYTLDICALAETWIKKMISWPCIACVLQDTNALLFHDQTRLEGLLLYTEKKSMPHYRTTHVLQI